MNDTPTLPDLEHMARQAGKILHDAYENDIQVSYKGVIDLVTDVDHASEDYILGEIQRRFPTHRILSEEAGGLDGHDEHLWLVDPIDGTVNFAHGVPFSPFRSPSPTRESSPSAPSTTRCAMRCSPPSADAAHRSTGAR
jgi:fructose-1,6-bisphosphatase/inositol monophosphatase family enzyme